MQLIPRQNETNRTKKNVSSKKKERKTAIKRISQRRGQTEKRTHREEDTQRGRTTEREAYREGNIQRRRQSERGTHRGKQTEGEAE